MSALGLGLNLINELVGPGFPASVNVPGGFGGVGGVSLGTAGSSAGQTFMTRALPNTRFAYYTLAIYDPSNSLIMRYTFPITPSAITNAPTALTNIYDVLGPGNQNGVTRIADVYGNAPPLITLQGTTGWQYHSTDGYSFTGIDSLLQIKLLLNTYAQRNADQIKSGNSDLYTMEFYDYFLNEFWQVVPIGPQNFRQVSDRPLVIEYNLKFAALQSLSSGPATQTQDNLAANLVGGATTSLGSTLVNTVNSTLSNYAPVTLGVAL